jgi:hypothetical protein
MAHELIELVNWPSMPSPWDSIDEGEAWVWGDFVMLLQTKPMLVAEMLNEMTGKKNTKKPPLNYPYALTVYYRKDRNPHGPSSRSIMAATLEIADYSALGKLLGQNIQNNGPQEVVKGLFTANQRYNLGNYDGKLDKESVRTYFFSLMRKQLSLSGEPKKIGKISDIHGHPETGWPAKEKKSSGCFSLFVTLSIAFVLLYVYLNF